MEDNANDYTTCEEDPNTTDDGPISLESAINIDNSTNDYTYNNNQINLNTLIITEKKDRNLVFGNDIKNNTPWMMGRLFTCLFINKQPVFAIGPQCNITK